MTKASSPCPVCGASLEWVFKKQILQKYDVDYFACERCSLLRTEEPYWFAEAYSTAIADMDTGLAQRNLVMAATASEVIRKNFDVTSVFLDYAGGYGLFVRLMRDSGFDFYWDDKYCDNIFARFFSRHGDVCSYEMVTAFEFFEHVTNPLEEAENMAAITNNILFSTEVLPTDKRNISSWWYLVPETGQHIVFYSMESLRVLAGKLGMEFYTNGRNLHMFSRRGDLNVFHDYPERKMSVIERIKSCLSKGRQRQQLETKLESLTWPDHIKIKEALQSQAR